jgi:hypothetical protein
LGGNEEKTTIIELYMQIPMLGILVRDRAFGALLGSWKYGGIAGVTESLIRRYKAVRCEYA